MLNRRLLLIFLAGLVLRSVLAVLFHARQVEGLTVSYFTSASDLLAGDPFLVDKGVEILHPYGYSVLILLVQVVTEHDDAATLIGLAALQVGLDTVAIWFMYVAGRNLHSRTVGLWIAGAYALNPLIGLSVTQPMPEALSPFLMAALLASTSMIWRDRPRWAVLAGIVCGTAYHFRSEFLLLPAVLAAYVVLNGRLRQEARSLGVLFVVTGLFVLPVALGTWAQTGVPRVNTTNAGGTMWQALGERPDNPWGLRLGDQYVAEEARRLGFPSPWGPEANDHFKDEWLKAVRDHPAAYVDLVLTTRIPRVFDTRFIRWNYVQYAVGIWQVDSSMQQYVELRQGGLASVLLNEPRLFIVTEPVGWLIRLLAMVSFGVFFVYVVTNIRHPRRWLLLALPFAYFVVTLCLIKFVEPRQFFCLLPLYSFAVGGVLHHTCSRLKRKAAR